MWAAFEAERPRILGALLDAAAKGLAMLPQTRLDKLPRMADFALWATACETALWPSGTFWSAYCGNRDEAVEGVIEADPIAAAVRALMATRTEWTGTASELLGALAEMAGERVAKSKAWPDSPRALAGRLRRAATFLRKIGIEIGFEPRRPGADADHPHHHRAIIRARNRRGATVRIVRTVRRSAETHSCQWLSHRGLRTVGDGADGSRARWFNRPRQPLKPTARPMRTVRTQISHLVLRRKTRPGWGRGYERGRRPQGGISSPCISVRGSSPSSGGVHFVLVEQ